MSEENTSSIASNPESEPRTDPTRIIEGGARLLRVLFALRTAGTAGLTNQDIAKGLDLTPGTVNRLLNTAIAENFAKRLETGRFALGKSLLDIASAHRETLEREAARLNEHVQHTSAGRWR